MSLFDKFYRIYSRAAVLEKNAEYRPAVAGTKLAFWNDAKTRAAYCPEGMTVGLAKLALSLLDEAHASGIKTASLSDAEPFAASFACAYVVDQALEKMASDGEITSSEHSKLANLNAQAAFDDLEKIAFDVRDLTHMIARHPHVSGMVLGAALGAGIGAINDGENPARGAAAGASLGAAVGALGGASLPAPGGRFGIR